MLNDVNCSYTYDGEQRMASATCAGVATYYLYDGEGQRVAKLNASGAVTEQDVYNTAGQVLMRYNGSGGWTEGEVWAEGNHLAIYANGQTCFPLTDQVGTERARFVSTGGIVQTCMSQPFGDNLECTGTDSSPYKFGRLERDGESGDDHAQHRDYNSNPYRWLTPDPAGEKVVVLTDPQTWNLYMYSHDNPVTDNDPTGLQEQPDRGPVGGDASPRGGEGRAPCTLSPSREPCGDVPGVVQLVGMMQWWAFGQVTAQNEPPDPPKLDKDKVVKYMDEHAKGTDTYHGTCTAVCHAGLVAGGLTDTKNRPIDANENGPFLEKHGAVAVGRSDTATLPNGYSPRKADVAIFEGGTHRNTSGHMEVYDGRQWVSDTKQTRFSPRRDYEGGVTIYRFPD
jgi:RHS repeat-associated protein